MTDATMGLRQMLGKGSDATSLREMIGFAAQRLIELEVGELTGAAPGERSPDRLVRRNGYRERDWQTRVGSVELRIPKLTPAAAVFDSRDGDAAAATFHGTQKPVECMRRAMLNNSAPGEAV